MTCHACMNHMQHDASKTQHVLLFLQHVMLKSCLLMMPTGQPAILHLRGTIGTKNKSYFSFEAQRNPPPRGFERGMFTIHWGASCSWLLLHGANGGGGMEPLNQDQTSLPLHTKIKLTCTRSPARIFWRSSGKKLQGRFCANQGPIWLLFVWP